MGKKLKNSVVLESKMEEEEDDQAPFYEEVKSDLGKAGLLEEALSPEEIEKLPVHEQWGIDYDGKKIVPHAEKPAEECEIPTCDIHKGNETDKALRNILDQGEKELEETTTKVLDFVEGHLKPKMKYRDCYCVMKGRDKIVMAFIADEFSEKSLGQIFKVIGEARLSMDNATTLSASELFDRQQVEEPEPEKTLFDKLED